MKNNNLPHGCKLDDIEGDSLEAELERIRLKEMAEEDKGDQERDD